MENDSTPNGHIVLDIPQVYTERHWLTAGQCGAEGKMPVTLLVSRAIEAATAHAGLLGIGYADLHAKGLAWVLSKMSVEVLRYPTINERYNVSTWIESWSRHLSERNFEVTDQSGRPIAYIRSVWASVDMKSRSIGDLLTVNDGSLPMTDRPCPIAKPPRITPGEDNEADVTEYTFQYCDIDFNRHVNSVKYLNAILNRWPLERFDKYRITRLDVAYLAECRYGQTALIRVWDNAEALESAADIFCEGRRRVAVRINWEQV